MCRPTSKIFGLTFAIKHIEKKMPREYRKLTEIFPEAKEILEEEEKRERELINLIDEERL